VGVGLGGWADLLYSSASLTVTYTTAEIAGDISVPSGFRYVGPLLGAEPPSRRQVKPLVAQAAAGMGVTAASMQTLIVITARFARVAWKYESIAYQLVLKHVGVLIQTMYLVATAMELAPCAVGNGGGPGASWGKTGPH
jgi:hypothetical protein